MTRTTLAVAADYADALLVARRSKNALFLALLLVLLIQLAIFVLYKYDVLHFGVDKSHLPTTSTPADTTLATTATTQPVRGSEVTYDVYRFVLSGTSFLGMTLVIVLGVVLLLTAVIMLVGRLIGVSHVTSAFVWCVLLAVLLFPWQSLLNSYGSDHVPDQKIPGVLYTWTEVEQYGKFANQPLPHAILHWARFAGFPVVAILVLMMVQAKSGRGLRFALGESDMPLDVTTGARPTEGTL